MDTVTVETKQQGEEISEEDTGRKETRIRVEGNKDTGGRKQGYQWKETRIQVEGNKDTSVQPHQKTQHNFTGWMKDGEII